MPRLKNAVPKYRRHKASGQAIVTIGGRDHYIGPHGTQASKDAYDRIIGEWLASGRLDAPFNGGGSVSVTEVLSEFWIWCQDYYRKNGKKTTEVDDYRRVIKAAREAYGDTPASMFGPLSLKAVRQQWIDKGMARSTINRNQRRLVRIFKWAAAEEMISPNIWQALASVEGLRKGRTAAPEAKPIPPVAIDRVETVMPYLSPVLRAMIRVQLLTGMRPGEVCRLRPVDIDRSGNVWEYRPDGHKTEHHDRKRTVYIGPQAQEVLQPFLFRDPDASCFSASESREWYRAEASAKRTTPPSCGNSRGKRSGIKRPAKNPRAPRGHFDASSYGHAVARACEKAWPPPPTMTSDAEIKAWNKRHRWSPNQLRHTRATEIRKRFGLEAAQVILGHASADVTQVYAERDAELARRIMGEAG